MKREPSLPILVAMALLLPQKLKPVYRWAVVSADGKLCTASNGVTAIYAWKVDAERDCADRQHVERIRIIPVNSSLKR